MFVLLFGLFFLFIINIDTTVSYTTICIISFVTLIIIRDCLGEITQDC